MVQQQVLAEKKLTFEVEYELAVTLETTAKQQKVTSNKWQEQGHQEITAKVRTTPKNTIKRQADKERDGKQSSQRSDWCYSRLFSNHEAIHCKFKNSVLFQLLGKEAHVLSVLSKEEITNAAKRR